MSPEQFAHGICNVTTDLYSLGATYFASLTGSPPFGALTLVELQEAHRAAVIPDVRKTNPAIPGMCSRIIYRCLAKLPEERYQTVDQLITDLESLLTAQEKSRPLRRRSLILTLAGAVTLALVAEILAIGMGTPAQSSNDPVAVPATIQPPRGSVTPVSTKVGPWEPLFNGRDLTGWEPRDFRDTIRPDMEGSLP